MLLKGKTALITGASRGIGKAIALAYAAEGCDIAFTYIVTKDFAERTCKEIEALGVKCMAYASDASSFDGAHEVVKQVIKDFGKLDILVNNAGITQDSLIMRMTESQWDDVLSVNLKAAFNYIHAVTPVMLRQRSGSIISISSVVGLSGNAGQTNYAASKAGLIGLTKSTAKELGSRGVRANAIAPGLVITEMTNVLPDKMMQEYLNLIPMHRCGTPEDVAKVALFLASDLSEYVSGQVIQVNGAMN